MKIHPVTAKLFHEDRWMDRHDKASSGFHNFANAPRMFPRTEALS